MTAVEDRLAEIEARARENWPTSEDVATVAAALRAVLALHKPRTVDDLACMDCGDGCTDDHSAQPVCAECRPTVFEGETGWWAWPCPTYARVATALVVTP